jgi:hypothetical protein
MSHNARRIGGRRWGLYAIFAVACVVSTDAQKSASEPHPNLEGTWRLSPGLGTPRFVTQPPFPALGRAVLQGCADWRASRSRRVVPCAWCSSHHEGSVSL